ncbi:outer membrane protein TolC [Bradyrhizobium sp. USDA 4524]|uniref:TolC family protein n=1 Tax=unclassified Bradyrhizobium TaxID=2631580 RepID=UPI00209DCF42|nr:MULTISPECIES: TolC family protein [unclassified Bradyrhizobium]MCP1843589.1 outer membrane protein TolC [Bradyrhizobium sp. USDA 4538]MCP1904155.1 outer membrane protein TolC [Bradyrhizobium sp. USDA 4537]MCP1990189.1 outer membrane protein TolC [Bradyrhizobium sp. USDA 4539]
MRHLAIAPLLLLTSALAGCASFSSDSGMGVVSEVTGQAIGKDVAFVRGGDGAATVDAAVKQLLARNLTADAAVQVALLNNKGLQAAYNELALAETDYVADSLPPSPTFSVSRITGNGASEVERQVVGDILALATLPARSEIARERFRQAQLKAALATLRLAAEVRRSHVAAVAANEMVGLLTDAKATAESTAQLAKKLGETGGMNKLDQAREQVFYAEITADLASARQNATSSRERLARLLGLWDGDLGFRIPGKLPLLPKRPLEQPSIEVAAVGHRVDLQIARMEIVALAKALDLTEATRFVTLLDVAGIDKRTHDPEAPPFRERGFDVQFQIPIFDGGEVRVRQAAETYRQAMNRLTEKAINIRSEARDAYRVYRSTYDIARHYQREVLPLRQIITEEMQLRFSSMQVDVFALLTEARQRLASLRAAIDAKRDFLLAQSELQTAINGGGSAGAASTPSSIASAAQPAAGGGH